MGLGFGVLAAACQARGLPSCSASPQEIKLATTGGRSASKAEVMACLDVLAPEMAPRLLEAGIPRSKQDHAYDAFGAVLACQQSDLFKMAVTR
jgi:Holliday junction resolvasome RuvABC endonuclease subunit